MTPTTGAAELPEALRLADNLQRAVNQTDADDDVIHVARWFVEDAIAALRASRGQAPAGVLEDAARYRWLREGNDAKHGAAWHVAVNLYGCEWDAAIDAARKQGEKT